VRGRRLLQFYSIPENRTSKKISFASLFAFNLLDGCQDEERLPGIGVLGLCCDSPVFFNPRFSGIKTDFEMTRKFLEED